MKKRITLFVLAIVLAIMLLIPSKVDLFSLIPEATDIYIYTGNEGVGRLLMVTSAGNIEETHCTMSDVKAVMRGLSDYRASTVVLSGDYDTVRQVLGRLKAEVVDVDQIEERLFIYGYSPKLRRYCMINGEKINLQLCVKECGEIIVGSPLIVGSY